MEQRTELPAPCSLTLRSYSVRRFNRLIGCIAVSLLPVASAQTPDQPDTWLTTHPRLYATPRELTRLRALREEGVHARIWKNLVESADGCLDRTPRREWIAPLADDPNYENLYDRFYAMMMDMAITEHLAFAYALSNDSKYGDAARDWTLACCRAWKNDANAEPDGGKAYAAMRLLKGIAVGYDFAHDRFTQPERDEIRSMLAATADNYHRRYFQTPERSGPGFHTHHAIVEYSSFGVAALALLGESQEARTWVDSTVKKFEDHLLPNGLAADGAQVEGATFWASTLQYRLFFMDALRRVTGRDLFTPFGLYMNAELALASIAAEKRPGWNEPHQTVVLSPSYGQLDYYAPVLLALAREYGKPIYQYLALWDHSLGRIQETRYITPNRREQLMFELGGYAYVWYDPRVPVETGGAKLSYAFPSVYQAYARSSWKPGAVLVAMDRNGQTLVHAAGTAILIASGITGESTAAPSLDDNGETATIAWKEDPDKSVIIRLARPNRVTIEWRGLPPEWSFWGLETPVSVGDTLLWRGRVQLNIRRGRLAGVKAGDYAPVHAVGNGKLPLADPSPRTYPLIRVESSEGGELEIDITQPD